MQQQEGEVRVLCSEPSWHVTCIRTWQLRSIDRDKVGTEITWDRNAVLLLDMANAGFSLLHLFTIVKFRCLNFH